MQRALVMTVIGQDRPGLVDTIAGLVAGHAGNWLESRMSRLGGQFAGILRVEVPEEQVPPLSAFRVRWKIASGAPSASTGMSRRFLR